MAPAYSPVYDIKSHTLAPNPKRQKTEEVIDLVGESLSIDGEGTIPMKESVANGSMLRSEDRREKPPYYEPPFFSIRGAVDGIREELAPSGNPTLTPGSPGDDSWVLNRVIVECKHRMSRLQVSPPLYEQIQTTAYCLMYEVQDADIVQVLRKQWKPKPKPSAKKKKEENILPKVAPITQFFSSKSSEKENAVKGVEHQNAPNDVGSGNTGDTSKAKPQELADAGSAKKTTKSHGGEEMKSDLFQVALDSANLAEKPQASCDTCDSTKGGNVLFKPPVSVHCNSQQQQVEESTADTTSPVVDDDVAFEIGVNRVSIDDPILQHQQNWNHIILPRLRSWTDAVYTVRRCDDKRYRLLQSMIEPPDLAQVWQIIFEECSWLKHCDTAYHRDVS
jgi:hypothetical protein